MKQKAEILNRVHCLAYKSPGRLPVAFSIKSVFWYYLLSAPIPVVAAHVPTVSSCACPVHKFRALHVPVFCRQTLLPHLSLVNQVHGGSFTQMGYSLFRVASQHHLPALFPTSPGSRSLSLRSVSFFPYHVVSSETIHCLYVVCLPPLGYVPRGQERALSALPFTSQSITQHVTGPQ